MLPTIPATIAEGRDVGAAASGTTYVTLVRVWRAATGRPSTDAETDAISVMADHAAGAPGLAARCAAILRSW